jgi:DNA-binding protein YbaB
MIKIAMNDAISKVEKETEAKLGSYGKQLGGLI